MPESEQTSEYAQIFSRYLKENAAELLAAMLELIDQPPKNRQSGAPPHPQREVGRAAIVEALEAVQAANAESCSVGELRRAHPKAAELTFSAFWKAQWYDALPNWEKAN